MSTSISPIFTGMSSYASDLQSVISRAVAIASLPLNQLQNELQDMNGQSSALGGLDNTFASLQTAIGSLNTALGARSYSAVSSDTSAATASVSSGALEGSYTLDISSVGSYSTSLSDPSLPAVSDPYSTSISTSSSYTLTVNGRTVTISPSDGSLMSLAQALNSGGLGVQASVVNTGSTASPQYELVVRSANLGPDTIQLNDGSRDLLNSLSTGTMASYTVNGLSTPIQSTSRTVTLAPGVTVQLVQPTNIAQPVTISVSRNMNAAESVISDFVNAYNAAQTALSQQVGQNAGQLSGQSIVRTLFSALHQITQYTTNAGGIQTLTALGINLDSTGKLSFDQSAFESANISDIASFLGGTTTGGFLKLANDTLTEIEDPTSGSLKTAIQQVQDQITHQNDLIAKSEQQVSDLQTRLQQQMAAADAAIASLESQKNYITNLFTAMLNNSQTGVKSS